MNIVLTGANGFVGRALAQRLLAPAAAWGALGRLTLIDLSFEGPEMPRVRRLSGSIADPVMVSRAFDTPVDILFHLASVPGGMAEQNFDLGRRVNLEATVGLLEAARAQALTSGRVVKAVFASSIAVLGAPLPERVTDATPLRPKLSYGAHKLMGEIMFDDYSRRGWIDSRAVRLPGIVARPPQPTGQLSAFMSDIIRELAAGRRYDCPVSADSTAWLMSLQCVVNNFIHAAGLPPSECTRTRTWTLPALRASMSELVEAIAQVYGNDASTHVTYRSNPPLEANFGRYPPLETMAADAAGFLHDGDVRQLVRRALEPTTCH